LVRRKLFGKRKVLRGKAKGISKKAWDAGEPLVEKRASGSVEGDSRPVVWQGTSSEKLQRPGSFGTPREEKGENPPVFSQVEE